MANKLLSFFSCSCIGYIGYYVAGIASSKLPIKKLRYKINSSRNHQLQCIRIICGLPLFLLSSRFFRFSCTRCVHWGFDYNLHRLSFDFVVFNRNFQSAILPLVSLRSHIVVGVRFVQLLWRKSTCNESVSIKRGKIASSAEWRTRDHQLIEYMN